MSQQIISALLGFLLGMLATLIVQWVIRRSRLNNPVRKRKLEHLQNLEKWMDSYRALFDSTYPECPELVLAHKMLSQRYPHYDKTAPVQLYNALKEYRCLQVKHDELTRQAQVSLEALADKNLDRLYRLNKAISSAFQKLGLLKGSLLFPVDFSTDINEHLKIVDQYREKVFEAFPRKIVQKIDWERLDQTHPEELASIIHPRLKYFKGDEAISVHRQTESRRFDEMQNLSFYRIVAQKEIETILHKIQHQEEKYSLGER